MDSTAIAIIAVVAAVTLLALTGIVMYTRYFLRQMQQTLLPLQASTQQYQQTDKPGTKIVSRNTASPPMVARSSLVMSPQPTGQTASLPIQFEETSVIKGLPPRSRKESGQYAPATSTTTNSREIPLSATASKPETANPTSLRPAAELLRFVPVTTTAGHGTEVSDKNTSTLIGGKALSMPGFLAMTEGADYQLDRQFAEGGGGKIFLGQLLTRYGIDRAGGQVTCAVKLVKEDSFPSPLDCRLAFQQEVSIMWLVNKSDYIAKILGYCVTPMSILMKFYELGTLYDLIHRKSQHVPDDNWTPRFVMGIAFDIAEGLMQLHDEGVVHSDVKPANIFLERRQPGKISAVVGDLGVACVVDSSILRVKAYQESRVKGASLPYAAPEVIASFKELSAEEEELLSRPETAKAGDVFSYAVVVYECLTRKFVWHGVQEDVGKLVTEGKRPKFPSAIQNRRGKDLVLDGICRAVSRAWSQDPVERPTFADVIYMFRNMPSSVKPLVSETPPADSSVYTTQQSYAVNMTNSTQASYAE